MSGAQTVSMGSKISTNLTWAWDSSKACVFGFGRTVHSAISGTGVNTVNAVWTRCGTYGGALVVVLGTATAAYIGNKAWHQKVNNNSLINLFVNVLGLAMLIGTGVATIAAVGAATGNVGYVAYGAGTLLTAFALAVPFDPENEEEEDGSAPLKRRSSLLNDGKPGPTVSTPPDGDDTGADESSSDETKKA